VERTEDLTILDLPDILAAFWNCPTEKGIMAQVVSLHEDHPCLAEDGVTLSCRIFRGFPEEPFVLFFPAEYDTDSDVIFLAGLLCQFGMTVASQSYRGCGKSNGTAGFSPLFSDAEVIFQEILQKRDEMGCTGPLVLMGRSIGAAIALDLAARHQESTLCLVLESAFDRTDDFLAGKGLDVDALGLRGRDPFCNRTKMLRYKNPVLFLHSSRDPVVSITQVEWLVCESRSKATQFQIVPSPDRESLARSTGEFYANAVKDFIHLRMGRRPPRKQRHDRTDKTLI